MTGFEKSIQNHCSYLGTVGKIVYCEFSLYRTKDEVLFLLSIACLINKAENHVTYFGYFDTYIRTERVRKLCITYLISLLT